MNRMTVLIMGGTVIVAILAALVAQRMMSPKAAGSIAKSPTEILVANRKLLQGEKIKAADVKWQAWPDASLFKGVFKRSDYANDQTLPVYGVPLRRSIESGEPVTNQCPGSAGNGEEAFSVSVDSALRAGIFKA